MRKSTPRRLYFGHATAKAKKAAEGGLVDRIAAIEAKLATQAETTSADALSDDALAAVARRIYRSRRRRWRHLPADLLGEPAWDMLLELFDAKVRGKSLPTNSLCLASRCPATTALRWLHVLEGHGMITRHADHQDRRVIRIRLTDIGFQVMRRYLEEAVRSADYKVGG